MTDYSELGFADNLNKEDAFQQFNFINPDTQIEDESIQGTKLMQKSVALDRLYGTNLQIGGNSNISGTFQVLNSANSPIITIDATNGLNIIDGSGHNVMSAIVSGTNVGTVTIGDYLASKGLIYDPITGNFTVGGAINMGTGSTLSASYITSGTIDAGLINVTNLNASNITSGNVGASYMQANVLAALQAVISNLSAIKADIGTVTAGTINGLTIIINHQSGGGDPGNNAYLRWSLGSRMWEDSNGNLGINSINTTGSSAGMYIYVHSLEKMFIGVTNINMDVPLYVPRIDLAFGGSGEGDIYHIDVLRGYNDLIFTVGEGGIADDFKFRDAGGTQVARIEHNTGIVHSLTNKIVLGGHTLTLTADVTISHSN
jgi:hypothetical protein